MKFQEHMEKVRRETLLSPKTFAMAMTAVSHEAEKNLNLELVHYAAVNEYGFREEDYENWLTEMCAQWAKKEDAFISDAMLDGTVLSCFKPLDQFQEEEASWLIEGWLPEGQITTMAADGGIGKTTVWCNLIAALSNGTASILDQEGVSREPCKVAFLTTEDSVRKKLKRKLRLAGADMSNIITPDFLADKEGLLQELKFGEPVMNQFVEHFKPALCVFDPIQGFVPPELNMGSRNAMRSCMAPLITLGEAHKTTFLVVCHTNKRKGAYGRDRIADSADLWDISRSVIMAGFTDEQGIRYLSNEKNNYTQLQETILFSIDDEGQVHKEGTSWKRDREYMQEADMARSGPVREDCKDYILRLLDENGGRFPAKELEENAIKAGYKVHTLRRSKEELKEEGKIKWHQTGNGKDKLWYVERTRNPSKYELLPD